MKKSILKVVSYILVFMMIVEVAIINIDISVFSKEKISLQDMSELKWKAVEWLKEKQNEDGSFGDSIYTYYTTQVLENLAYQNDFDDEKSAALSWIEKTEINSNDDMFRIYLAKVKESEYLDTKPDNVNFNDLQNSDGGFGLSKGYGSDVMDTVLAINCMLESDKHSNSEIRKSINYLLSCQNEDGGFSYSGTASNTYLTAYAFKCIKSYLNESANSAIKMMADECEEYLLTSANDNSLWGLDEDTIRNSLMSSIALVSNDEDTVNRISIISDKLSEDGSMYGDVELTSLYVSLINEYEIATGNETLNHAKIKELKVSADKERIGAYTEVLFVPNIIGINDTMKVMAVVTGTDGGSEILEMTEDNTFVWNTKNNIGTHEVLIAVADKEDGRIIASKMKTIEVLESFEVAALNCSVSPKAYKIGSGKNIKIDTSGVILANVDKELTAQVSIVNEEGDTIYTESKTFTGGTNDKEIYFDEMTYTPEVEKSTLLSVITSIKLNEKTLKTKTNYIKAYTSEDENRIDVDYELSSDYIYPDDDELDISFTLSGKGVSENVKRRPMDIVIILDNSGSMKREDWIKAIEGAKIIIDYMQPQDRAEIRYINKNEVQVEFSSDKEYLKSELDKRYNQWLWSGTKVYNALNLSVGDFTEEDRDRAIYIFTDGVRDGDVKTLNEQELIDNEIKVYSVFMECNASASAVEKATEIMNHIADITGGAAINIPTNDEIAECVTNLLGDMFKMAGKDVTLTMTLEKNVSLDDMDFSVAPDNIIENEDGTTTITFEKNYLSVGEDFELNLNYSLLNLEAENELKLIKDIVFTYTAENDEVVTLNLDDIIVNVINNISSVVPDEVIEDDGIDDEKTVVMTENNESNILSHNKPEEKEMQNNPLITGSVTIADNSFFVGDTVVADVELENMQNDAVSEINTRIVLIDRNNESNVSIVEEKIELSGTDITKGQIEIGTENLYEGDYIAILMADINGEMVPLDAKGVTLVEHRYTFMVMADKGGNVSDVNGEYKAGEVITVSAIAEDGFVFDRWESEDMEIEFDQMNKSEIEIVMPERAVTIKAVFAEKKVDEKQEDDKQGSKDNIVDIGGNIGSDNKNSNITVEKDESNNQTKVDEEKVNDTKTSNKETVKDEKNNAEKEDMNDKEKNDKSQVGNESGTTDEEKAGTGKSPLTGDFDLRDNIRLLLLIQSIALILICITLKKKEQKEEQQCH